MSLTDPIIPLLAPFQSLFHARSWPKVLLLVRGTILVRGRRTVTAALRVMGHSADPAFACYHHLLNRAVWSPLAVSHVLLLLLVSTFLPTDAIIEVVIDEHLERRWGPQITKRGHYRDPLLSGKGRSVSTSGLRWICCMLVVHVPWSEAVWALPFLTILTTPPAVDSAAGRRHKTSTIWAQQVVCLLRRWLPGRAISLIGDGNYSSLDLGNSCVQRQVQLVAPLRLDANLFATARPRRKGQRGPERVKGAALPKLSVLLEDECTPWTRAALPWYAAGVRDLEWCSGLALWYHGGKAPLPLRWVLTRDPQGEHPPRAFLQTQLCASAVPLEPSADAAALATAPAPLTDQALAAQPCAAAALPQEHAAPLILGADAAAGQALIAQYQLRWRLEVTLEESRAHLGVETQRQWSELAIQRSTPGLLGLFSLVVLLGQCLHADGSMPVRQAAWYHKEQATFSDVVGRVREQLWAVELFDRRLAGAEQIIISQADLARVMQAAAA